MACELIGIIYIKIPFAVIDYIFYTLLLNIKPSVKFQTISDNYALDLPRIWSSAPRNEPAITISRCCHYANSTCWIPIAQVQLLGATTAIRYASTHSNLNENWGAPAVEDDIMPGLTTFTIGIVVLYILNAALSPASCDLPIAAADVALALVPLPRTSLHSLQKIRAQPWRSRPLPTWVTLSPTPKKKKKLRCKMWKS